MSYQIKVKTISTKGLTKVLINKFSILDEAKYFFLGIFQNYLLFIPPKNTLNILMALLVGLIRGKYNEIPKENIEKLTKSDSTFASTSVDDHLLSDITFNGYCLIFLFV